jgi:DNA-binding MarR family transcriptional regulator
MARRSPGVTNDQVDAVMFASRALVGITAASIAEVDDRVTLPQLRTMMMIATRGPMNLVAVAAGLGVSSPNASRICDRLLKAGMLDRSEDLQDRRHITLTLTADGDALVARLIRYRRNAIRKILRTMTPRERDDLVIAMNGFADAASEPLGEPSLVLI